MGTNGDRGGGQHKIIECLAKDVIDTFIKVGETMAVMGSEPAGNNNEFMLLINFAKREADYWEDKKVGGVALDRAGVEFTINALQQILEQM